jgi:hypothetical protein
MITIHKPIMRADLGRHFIGVAADKLYMEPPLVDIMITYRLKSGKLMYPNLYKMKRSEIVKYHSEVIKGRKIHIFPIDVMHECITR